MTLNLVKALIKSNKFSGKGSEKNLLLGVSMFVTELDEYSLIVWKWFTFIQFKICPKASVLLKSQGNNSFGYASLSTTL